MNLPREQVLAYFCRTYAEEFDDLGGEGIESIIFRGRTWELSDVLTDRGALVFPHVHIADCGPYVGAVVEACLDSGADQILAIGVLHASDEAMNDARARLVAGQTRPEDEPLRGIYGPDSPNPSPIWRRDHSLYGFRRLLPEAAKLRGVRTPRLVERYPFLTGPRPESLPGIGEVKAVASDSVVVATADHCHHGIGYGHSRAESFYFDEKGLAHVRRIIEDGLALLDAGQLDEYDEHCRQVAKSDWRDAGPLVQHVLGPLHSTVLDVVPSDFSKSIYQAPAPTWCAGALVSLQKRP